MTDLEKQLISALRVIRKRAAEGRAKLDFADYYLQRIAIAVDYAIGQEGSSIRYPRLGDSLFEDDVLDAELIDAD